MVRSIDPQREILRHAQWPFSPRSLTCLELVLRKTILASVHMRAHLQAKHMDASDLIVTNLQKDLASRGPSTGRANVSESAALPAPQSLAEIRPQAPEPIGGPVNITSVPRLITNVGEEHIAY
jgi:hypothetical protein